MKNNNKTLKALVLSIVLAAGTLLPTGGYAQENIKWGGGLFGRGASDDSDGWLRGLFDLDEERDEEEGISNYGFGEEAPLGSGIAIILVAGLGYWVINKKKGGRAMRRMTCFVMALALVLGLAQCKKDEMPVSNQTECISITLEVDGDASAGPATGDSKADVTTGTGVVTFEDNDVIYVGYNSAYVGTLTYGNGKLITCISISSAVWGLSLPLAATPPQ